MSKIICAVSCLLLLGACSNGVSLYVSDEKNSHYRTFVRITDVEDTEKVWFNIRKRDRQVVAEKELFHRKKTSLSIAGGKDKDKDWSGGLVLRYNF